MIKSRRKFLLHARVTRTDSEEKAFDDTRTGHQTERRLNRLERVSAAYRGQISLRFENGMLVTFDSADAALLGACEMQNRCAVLPQSSWQKLALCIGIHQGVMKQRSKDTVDNTREFAARLARIDDGILISQTMLDGLNQDLKNLARPLKAAANDPESVFTIDWHREIPPGAYGGESFWPTAMHATQGGPILQLHFGLKKLEVSEHNPVTSIGRDPLNDLVLDDFHVSRYHCRIERTPEGVVLIDQSTNGTSIISDDGTKQLVKNESAPLAGSGLLFFGRPFKGERRGSVRYELM